MKRIIHLACLFLISTMISSETSAQETKDLRFTPATTLNLTGQVYPSANPYDRLDTTAFPEMPSRVKQLLTNSAGLMVCFSTNSSSIGAKWTVTKQRAGNNMTPIAHKGLDLYIKTNSGWQYAGVGRPGGITNEAMIVKNLPAGVKECMLYLPLYDAVSDVEIGVDTNSTLEKMPLPFAKKILVYGSSIVQGASASRPGMTYTAQLARQMGLHFINMGVSGSAKMEKAVADAVAGAEADAFLLDCIPNSTTTEIKERTAYLVKTIRAKHPNAPIIVMQTVIREGGYFDTRIGAAVSSQNRAITAEINALKKGGMKNLYFITAEDLLGHDHEATVDGTHPTDLGFYRMATFLKPVLTEILSKHGITK